MHTIRPSHPAPCPRWNRRLPNGSIKSSKPASITPLKGLHWVGPDGTIVWANQTELDLLGYTRAEYIGHHSAEFHVDRPVIEDILLRLTRCN